MEIKSFLGNGDVAFLSAKNLAERIIKKLLARGIVISDSGSEGGYLSVWNADLSGLPQIVNLLHCGNFPKEKRVNYFYYSHEKAYRLNTHINDGHDTSLESSNKEEDEYEGAIYFEEINQIISFSGIKAKYDAFISACEGVLIFLPFAYQFQNKGMSNLNKVALFKKKLEKISGEIQDKQIMVSIFLELID